jgi:hypothetical protein
MDGVSKTDLTQTVEVECEGAPAKDEAQASWETPKMEDVSEQVMAQPYIRFT